MPLMLGAVSTHTTGLQRVKLIIVAISDTALCRTSVHSAVKGHLSRNMFRGEGVRAATPFFFFFLQKQKLQRIMKAHSVQ